MIQEHREKIIQIIQNNPTKLNTKQISDISELNWATTKKHLLILLSEKKLYRTRKTNYNCWHWVKYK